MKISTLARLHHKYRIEEHIENGELTKNLYKTPYAIMHFYGDNAREWSERFHERKMNPIEFLVQSGFYQVTDDNWTLDIN